MKTGLSYTSHDNAVVKLEKEIPHWDFESVVDDSKNEWNRLLSRVEVHSENTIQQKRFYTDQWHSLQGRRILSDVNGAYSDNTGASFRIS